MGAELSTQNQNGENRDPPTPSTVKSFLDDVSPSVRNPPIDNPQAIRSTGRLTRFLSDALPNSKTSSKAPIPQEIHVVREAGSEPVPTIEDDPDMKHLLSLPTFTPILRTTLNNTVGHPDPDVVARLDYRKILMIGLRYQQHLRQCADLVANEQQNVSSSVKTVEKELSREVTKLAERQKQMVKYVEVFNALPDITRTLDKIDASLTKAIEAAELLNDRLPPEHRLAPFQVGQ